MKNPKKESSDFKGKNNYKEEELPWYNKPSIYEHVKSNLDSNGKLTADGYWLPDEERWNADNKLTWVPGCYDMRETFEDIDYDIDEALVEKVAELTINFLKTNSLHDKVQVYNSLVANANMRFQSLLTDALLESKMGSYSNLHDYAKWLAFESPDRGPVKLGLEFLTMIYDKKDFDKIYILGKHEEFTLSVVGIISKWFKNPEPRLWELAKLVNGWGKIITVNQLSDTENKEIKSWLIREGYKNDIMNEYLAYDCAVWGDLKGELLKPEVDDELLEASGDIIDALLVGGPPGSMEIYPDGPDVIRLYLMHIQNRANQLRHFLTLKGIQYFMLDEDGDWDTRIEIGWSNDVFNELMNQIQPIVTDPKWAEMVIEGLDSDNEQEFLLADKASIYLGDDLWETHWNRLMKNPTDINNWVRVMRNSSDANIDQIISFANDTIPLDKIATGPEVDFGTGRKFNDHHCLDSLLKGLGMYPGVGFNLIKTGLRSPFLGNRSKALNVLSEWGDINWPEETRELLQKAMNEEPDPEIAGAIVALLNGEEIDINLYDYIWVDD